MIPIEQKALTLCIALCDTVIYGTVWAEHKSALKLALAELLKAFLHRTSTKVSSSIFYRIATTAKVLLHKGIITGSLSSAPPSPALSSGNNTREHTYSRNERMTEKERESIEGGGQGEGSGLWAAGWAI